MHRHAIRRLSLAAVAAAAVSLVAAPAAAQSRRARPLDHRHRSLAGSVIVPQTRAFTLSGREAVQISEVNVGVVIVEQAATTTMDVSLENPSGRRQEAEVILPVPQGAVVRGFTFQGAGSEPTAELLPRDEARKLYESIVRKIRDPALLEFAGYNLIRSSVFPVPPRGTQKVRITYEHLLPADGERVDYVLPRSESLEYRVPWKVAVRIKSKRPVSTVYSPSHKLQTTRRGENIVSARIASDAVTEPGAFRLSYLLEKGGVTASFFAYPDAAEGGYFLMLAGLPARPAALKTIKREVTLVIDRSGSMHGRKIEQVREAALQILAGLDDGEAFNVISYNEAVDAFAAGPVLKNDETTAAARKYISAIKPRGGTNIHDALLESLRQKPREGLLPIVLFLTDGLPTVGQTSEVAIRNVAMKANPHSRRIFTFGVGVDVNTPLLEKIADESRARATFVLPSEDVEMKVAGVFKRLDGPVLAATRLEVADSAGVAGAGATAGSEAPDRRGPGLPSGPAPATRRSRVYDVLPRRLPDLFQGDQLVVLGRYRGEGPLQFEVSGNYLGRPRSFRFSFDVSKATTRNAFVPRLWASRKIGVLVDAIRQLGADSQPSFALPRPRSQAELGNEKTPDDPRVKELTDEILRLTKEHGILTEYTAFLAREGTDLAEKDQVRREALHNFDARAMKTRAGLGAVNQAFNSIDYKSQTSLNARNGYWDANMNRVEVTTVQQVADRAYFRKNGNWVDSRIVDETDRLRPQKVIEFGSEEYFDVLERLTRQGRQGTIALRGDILLVIDDNLVLIKGPAEQSR